MEVFENVTDFHYEMFHVDFTLVKTPFVITIWILIANISKITFHLSETLTSWMPEACILIMTGIAYGLIFYFTKVASKDDYIWFTYVFFFVLLPPIILNSGYYLYGHSFFDNFGTILGLAVAGTLFNALAIGYTLFGINVLGFMKASMSALDCLLYGSLISAVDPISVLAVFEEIHINECLYIIMFGESLLNDGVSMMLYDMFLTFKKIAPGFEPVYLWNGAYSFAFVSIGGIIVGILAGLITSYVTKYTYKIPQIEPLFMFAMSYLGYLVADIFDMSGILAIIACALVLQHYAAYNVSEDSKTHMTYLLRLLSSVSEAMIFLWMGISIFGDFHAWDTVFVVTTVISCLVYRAISIIAIIKIANLRRTVPLDFVEQFILSYSGLRGGIAFSLALSLVKNEHVPEDVKRIFLTTTIVMVLFTTFFQTLDTLMHGIHAIVVNFSIYDWILDRCWKLDQFYFRRIFVRGLPMSKGSELIEMCRAVKLGSMTRHVKTYGGNHCRLCQLYTNMEALNRGPATEIQILNRSNQNNNGSKVNKLYTTAAKRKMKRFKFGKLCEIKDFLVNDQMGQQGTDKNITESSNPTTPSICLQLDIKDIQNRKTIQEPFKRYSFP